MTYSSDLNNPFELYSKCYLKTLEIVGWLIIIVKPISVTDKLEFPFKFFILLVKALLMRVFLPLYFPYFRSLFVYYSILKLKNV